MLRGDVRVQNAGSEVSEKIKKGDFFAVELGWKNKEDTDKEPWCILRADTTLHRYEGEVKLWTGNEDESWMGQLNHNDMILHATKLEPLSTGNSIYTLTDKKMWVFGSDVRAIIRLDKHQVQRALTRRAAASITEKFRLLVAERQKILDSMAADEEEEAAAYQL